MNREEFLACLGEDLEFRVRRIGSQVAFDKALRLDSGRFNVGAVDNGLQTVLQATLDIATQEDEVHDYPEDWWQWVKQRWFPKWLLKRYPIRMTRIWSIHKFPEVSMPQDVLGREFVNFRIVNEDKLNRTIKNPQE